LLLAGGYKIKKKKIEALESSSSPRSPLHLQVSSIPMLLEPHPFAESAGQGYYAKSNSSSPTDMPHHAHLISTQEPPATPTPSAMDHHHHVKYESPSRRPPFQPVTTLKIPIPRRAEPPPSPDMGRPPHPSAVPASVQAQAALRRPAPAPKSSPPQPAKKGFHVVKYEKYEVKQERYYLPPSVKSPPVPGRHQQQRPFKPYHHASPPSEPSNHDNTHLATSEEDEINGSSSDDNNSNSDSSGSGSDGEEVSAPEESDDSDDEEVVEAVIAAPKNAKRNGGKRKRATSGTGKINFKEEAGSSFIDKNAHIKRPRNAWIHVSFTSMTTPVGCTY
jgi:hypothetical protein